MATTPFVLYTNPMSRGRMARWMLEETGLPYDTVLLDYGTSMKAADYLAINPMGKVPALVHGDAVVTEVAAIGLYLADLVPDKQLAPPLGSPERGGYYRWISFMAPLEQLMMAKHVGALGDPASAGYGTEKDLLGTLEAAIGDRQHLIGDGFTMADLVVAGNLGFYLQFGMLEPRDAFVRFARLHQARPAAKRAAAVDDGLVAQAKAGKADA
ncbi:MAG: glutathione S-transferase family protein [Pseudoxanthomonas suwonensis]|nr:glutathione S-transferase family protein [Pseudoxanthomonas suwonensis]